MITLKELFKITKGKKVDAIETPTPESIRYIQIDDLRNNNKLKFCYKEAKYIFADKEDIIIAWDGANAGTVGYGLEGAIGSTLAVLKTDSNDVYTPYIGRYLQSKFEYFRSTSTGATIPHISRKALESLKLPIPSLESQILISNTLDKVQSIIDKRKAQIEALGHLTESIFLEMFGDPLQNRKEWDLKPLGRYIEKIDSGWSPKCNSYPAVNGEKGVLKLSAVTKGIYKPTENKSLPDGALFKDQYEVKQGDILITRKNTRELVGACACVFETPKFLIIPDTIYRLVFNNKENISGVFLWRLLNNSSLRNKMKSLAEGSSGSMPNISKKKLLNFEIIAPPIELQNQFSKIIIDIEEKKLMLKQGEKLLEDNYNSIMQRAFKGELFTQEKLPNA